MRNKSYALLAEEILADDWEPLTEITVGNASNAAQVKQVTQKEEGSSAPQEDISGAQLTEDDIKHFLGEESVPAKPKRIVEETKPETKELTLEEMVKDFTATMAKAKELLVNINEMTTVGMIGSCQEPTKPQTKKSKKKKDSRKDKQLKRLKLAAKYGQK